MYRIELTGECFAHDREQTILLWCASKSEYANLQEFITFCWSRQYEEENYGQQTLEEWLAEFQMERTPAETFFETIQEYLSDLAYADIRIPKQYTNAFRLLKEEWNEVLYAAENEHDYLCFWWYTTA